jgi:hypothetical protein
MWGKNKSKLGSRSKGHCWAAKLNVTATGSWIVGRRAACPWAENRAEQAARFRRTAFFPLPSQPRHVFNKWAQQQKKKKSLIIINKAMKKNSVIKYPQSFFIKILDMLCANIFGLDRLFLKRNTRVQDHKKYKQVLHSRFITATGRHVHLLRNAKHTYVHAFKANCTWDRCAIGIRTKTYKRPIDTMQNKETGKPTRLLPGRDSRLFLAWGLIFPSFFLAHARTLLYLSLYIYIPLQQPQFCLCNKEGRPGEGQWRRLITTLHAAISLQVVRQWTCMHLRTTYPHVYLLRVHHNQIELSSASCNWKRASFSFGPNIRAWGRLTIINPAQWE